MYRISCIVRRQVATLFCRRVLICRRSLDISFGGHLGWFRGSLRQHVAVGVVMAVWVPAVGFGLRTLLRYSNTPGRAAAPPDRWPAGAPFSPADRRFTLLVFAHPQCGCSRATIEELARIVACCSQKVEATVLFYAPSTMPGDWTKTDLWDSATRIPGVRVLGDHEGNWARRFGVHTSGQTLLYDVSRHLVFKGGITASRGHSGDNDGRDGITRLLRGEIPRSLGTPVFGCALFEEP
jgi:hypothetical protein